MTLVEVDQCLEGLLVTPELERALAKIAAKPVAPKRAARGYPPRPDQPAGPVLSPFEAALIGERLIQRARTLVEDLTERAQKPFDPAQRAEQRAQRSPIDSDPLEARFERLERAKLEELERRFEQLERKAAERDGSK